MPLKWVKNRTNKLIFQINLTISPDTSNCIYMIYCIKCKRQYVGQTKMIYQHTHNIIHKIEKRRFVVQHFLSHGLLSLGATVLQTNSLWNLQDRLRMERLWIKKLDTLYPRTIENCIPYIFSSFINHRITIMYTANIYKIIVKHNHTSCQRWTSQHLH